MKKRFCPAGHDKLIVGTNRKRQCRECKREEDRRRRRVRPYKPRTFTEKQLEQKRRYAVATDRARRRLAKAHREEFARLFKEEYRKARDEHLVGVLIVPEHGRRLYGRYLEDEEWAS